MHDLTPDDLPDDVTDAARAEAGGADGDRASGAVIRPGSERATRAATDEDRVEADLSELSGPARAMLDALLTSAGIDHLWQGALLVAPASEADRVVDLIEEVEMAASDRLDRDRERVAYEVAEWSPEFQSALAERLGAAEIPFEWDERGDLVVYADDEPAVEEIFDALPDEDDPDAADAPEVAGVLGALWEAAEVLARRPADSPAVLSLIDVTDVMETMAVPYGFEPAVWNDLVRRAVELRAALEGDPAAPPSTAERSGDADDVDPAIGEAEGGAWWSDDDIAASAEALAARARDYL